MKGKEIYKKYTESLAFRKIQNEYFLIPIRGSSKQKVLIYTLNKIGSFVWDLIDGKKTVDNILSKILERYNVTPSQARRDLNLFINHLSSQGFIFKVKDGRDCQSSVF
jgi:hypothetical protein